MVSDIAEELSQNPAAKQWEKIGIRNHHGIVLPLFSLHSQESCGIGEFHDLISLFSWCKNLGLNVIQLLPLNDIGPDPSPYSAISAFALNPLNLSLNHLPNLTSYPDLVQTLNPMKEGCDAKRVDYSNVRQSKTNFLKEYVKREKQNLTSNPKYQKFLQENSWLKPYALFKAIKENTNWVSWQSWEEDLKNPSHEHLESLFEKFKDQAEYHCIVQYLCFEQFHFVKQQAEKEGIFLKGDIPILISRESADVWWNRNLFLTEFSAGAPPDMLASEGQNWGFPVYNWSAMAEDNYNWWKDRLRVAQNFYHLYRLDHIVGFFRIWAIPEGHKGNEGHFLPQDPNEWIPFGEQIMRVMLENTEILPIGEDLGTVPNEVRACLRKLGICGTKIIRWERAWETDRHFIPYNEYIRPSMTSVSTHDSETLQLWWKNNPNEASDFAAFKKWPYPIDLDEDRHKEILYDSHHTGSLFHLNLLQEYFAVIPELRWENPEDERINIPGQILDINWSYRFKPSVEKIISNENLKQLFQAIIK